MKVKLYNTEAKQVGEAEFQDGLLGREVRPGVLHLVTTAYLNNQRQGTAATKTKGMVAGGGKKPFKQKGTGQARQGSSRSPLMPGGGVSHGPQPRTYCKKINKKLKRVALGMALSQRQKEQRLFVVKEIPLHEFDAPFVGKLISKFNIKNSVLICDERKDNFLFRSARNFKGVSAKMSGEVNCKDILRASTLVISEQALRALETRVCAQKVR